jgi:energy-coupling factor transporter ATP-binding protein EcfA2
MLTKIRLQNFRGFSNHELPLSGITLIVGRNNAGKSTIIEALRLIALATARYKTMNYIDPPDLFKLPDSNRGISPSLRDLDFDRVNLFHRYGAPPAVVEAEFGDRGSITIHIQGSDDIFIVIRSGCGIVVQSRPQAKPLQLPLINILPQVAPVADVERALNPNYVRSAITSPRSSSHFRNQLHVFHELFGDFKKLCENNWPRLQIREFLTDCGELHNELELHIRDEDFVAEVRWMGHGLQIWLQTMWFLTRVKPDDVVVLDEPDVYLHADLQRKLIRILKHQSQQAIIATHSVEMISEVEPSNILVVDRRRRKSQFTASLPGVQEVIDRIGGVHNLHLARLWSTKKIIFVEGKDISLLKIFHDKLSPLSDEPIDILPNFPVGGWGGWSYVVGSSMLLETSGGVPITKYCIMDSDYHLSEEIQERYEVAKSHNIRLHIWNKKEIENYVINPATLRRHINQNKRKWSAVSEKEVADALNRMCEELKDHTMDNISETFIRMKRPKTATDGNRYARACLDARWTSLPEKLGIVSGKAMMSRISAWTQDSYGVGVNPHSFAKSMLPSELDPELASVIRAIENNDQFPVRRSTFSFPEVEIRN